MQEAAVLEYALGGILADDEAFEAAQVGRAVLRHSGLSRPPEVLRARRGRGGALARRRVRVEEAGHARAAGEQALDIVEAPKEVVHAGGVVARGRRHRLAAAIGFPLLIAAVGRQIHRVRQRHRERILAARDLLARRGVTRGRVHDLVREHVRELVLGVREHEQPARDVDDAARQRERVRRPLIDDAERILERARGRVREQALADRLDERLHLRVAHQSERGGDLALALFARALVVVLGREHDRAARRGR
jgi:hypothetical protein